MIKINLLSLFFCVLSPLFSTLPESDEPLETANLFEEFKKIERYVQGHERIMSSPNSQENGLYLLLNFVQEFERFRSSPDINQQHEWLSYYARIHKREHVDSEAEINSLKSFFKSDFFRLWESNDASKIQLNLSENHIFIIANQMANVLVVNNLSFKLAQIEKQILDAKLPDILLVDQLRHELIRSVKIKHLFSSQNGKLPLQMNLKIKSTLEELVASLEISDLNPVELYQNLDATRLKEILSFIQDDGLPYALYAFNNFETTLPAWRLIAGQTYLGISLPDALFGLMVSLQDEQDFHNFIVFVNENNVKDSQIYLDSNESGWLREYVYKFWLMQDPEAFHRMFKSIKWKPGFREAETKKKEKAEARIDADQSSNRAVNERFSSMTKALVLFQSITKKDQKTQSSLAEFLARDFTDCAISFFLAPSDYEGNNKAAFEIFFDHGYGSDGLFFWLELGSSYRFLFETGLIEQWQEYEGADFFGKNTLEKSIADALGCPIKLGKFVTSLSYFFSKNDEELLFNDPLLKRMFCSFPELRNKISFAINAREQQLDNIKTIDEKYQQDEKYQKDHQADMPYLIKKFLAQQREYVKKLISKAQGPKIQVRLPIPNHKRRFLICEKENGDVVLRSWFSPGQPFNGIGNSGSECHRKYVKEWRENSENYFLANTSFSSLENKESALSLLREIHENYQLLLSNIEDVMVDKATIFKRLYTTGNKILQSPIKIGEKLGEEGFEVLKFQRAKIKRKKNAVASTLDLFTQQFFEQIFEQEFCYNTLLLPLFPHLIEEFATENALSQEEKKSLESYPLGENRLIEHLALLKLKLIQLNDVYKKAQSELREPKIEAQELLNKVTIYTSNNLKHLQDPGRDREYLDNLIDMFKRGDAHNFSFRLPQE